MRDLASQFVKGFSSVDGKLLRSFRSILTAPGNLTRSYVRGERRRYLSPLALFLLANALFVGAQVFTGTNIFSTPLESHLNGQDWSPAARELVAQRLSGSSWSVTDYAKIFDQAAVFNAKALMILMVLALAPIMALIFYRRRRAAGVHVVFALHVYAFILVLLSFSLLLVEINLLTGGRGLQSPQVDLALSLFNLAVCVGYVFLAIRPVYGSIDTARVIEAVLLSFAIAGIFIGYRFVIFLITLSTT